MDLLERAGHLSRNAFAHARDGCIGCGSPIFLLDDWGGDHWLPQIGLRSLGHGSTLLTGSVGAISSDYCHENHSVMSESSRCHTICVLQELFTTKFESKGKICTHTYVQYYTHSHNIKKGYMLLNL